MHSPSFVVSSLPFVRYFCSLYVLIICPMKSSFLGRSMTATSLHSMHRGHSFIMGVSGRVP